MNNYYNIPERFRGPKSRVYCTHKDKVPNALPNKLETFQSFDEALASMKDDEGLGIGLWGALCGIDIDHCVNDGVISEEAQLIIDKFNSYAELSMSGTGVHILFLVHPNDQLKDRKDTYYIKLGKKHLKEQFLIKEMEGLEFYQGMYDHRFLTLTGNKIHDMNVEWVDKETIQWFLDEYFKRPPVPTSTVTFSSSDDEDKAWIKWALLVRKPEKLIQGWCRTPSGSGGTESEDDLEFMSNIAFWSNKNPAVMRAIFEASRYYKAKDDYHKKKWARKDYSEGVIQRAMSTPNVAKVYFEDSFCYDSTSKSIKEVPHYEDI